MFHHPPDAQLFRRYNLLPEFRLLDAGRTSEGFWREYELNSELVNCRIRENFRADTFDLGAETLMEDEQCAWEEADGRGSAGVFGGVGAGAGAGGGDGGGRVAWVEGPA